MIKTHEYYSSANLMAKWTHPISMEPWSNHSKQLVVEKPKLTNEETEVVNSMIEQGTPEQDIHVIRSLKQAVDLFGEKEISNKSILETIDESHQINIEEDNSPRQVEIKFLGHKEQIYEFDNAKEAKVFIQGVLQTSQHLDVQRRLIHLVMKKEQYTPTWVEVESFV